jgi:ABC-type Fe3+/spermidine/putrescine transport system ATPase subunit
MDGGRILQTGTPREVYVAPQSTFVMEFLGSANRISGRPEAHDVVVTDIGARLPLHADGAVLVFVRAEDVGLSSAPTPIHVSNPGRVELATFLGSVRRYVITWPGVQIISERMNDSHSAFEVGDTVYLDIDPAQCTLIAGDKS